ncbi:hypothetical protein BDR22DRAFT_821415 [Usnea florida]
MAKHTSTLMTIHWLFLLLLVGGMGTTLSPRTVSLQERIDSHISGESARAGKGKGEGKGKKLLVDTDAENTTKITDMEEHVFVAASHAKAVISHPLNLTSIVWASDSELKRMEAMTSLPPFAIN